MSSEPKFDPKKTARDKARQWYQRIEDRVAPVIAFSGLVIENTCRWAFEKRNQHPLTAHFHAKEFLRSPYKSVARFLAHREIEALSSLWNLSWDPPTYSNPRKVFPFIHQGYGFSARATPNMVIHPVPTDPLPTPPKDTPSE